MSNRSQECYVKLNMKRFPHFISSNSKAIAKGAKKNDKRFCFVKAIQFV